MEKTFVGNRLTNIMRWKEDINKYKVIYVDLQEVPIGHRRDIIDDLPTSLFSYGDECTMTVCKNDNVYIRMKYANNTNIIADENKLFIKIAIKPWDEMMVKGVDYMLSMQIQDTKNTMSMYEIFPLGNDLHLAREWYTNKELYSQVCRLEKSRPNIDSEKCTWAFENTTTMTTTYDRVFYNEHIRGKVNQ